MPLRRTLTAASVVLAQLAVATPALAKNGEGLAGESND